MIGYGKGEAKADGFTGTVEIRTVLSAKDQQAKSLQELSFWHDDLYS